MSNENKQDTDPQKVSQSKSGPEKLADALGKARPEFARELARARQIWHRYPHLILLDSEDGTIPSWLRQRLGNSPTEWPSLPAHETILISAGELQYAEPVGLEERDDDDEHLGSIQILRRESHWRKSQAQEIRQFWVRQLPQLLMMLGEINLSLIAVAAALIQSSSGDQTPFETFFTNLLEKSHYIPLDFNTVHEFLCSHPDGNMREYWEALIRATRRSAVDFPDGVGDIREEC